MNRREMLRSGWRCLLRKLPDLAAGAGSLEAASPAPPADPPADPPAPAAASFPEPEPRAAGRTHNQD